MEDATSPQRHIGRLIVPLVVTYGTFETPEFQRHARDFAAAVKAAGKPVEIIEGRNYHHDEMAKPSATPMGPTVAPPSRS